MQHPSILVKWLRELEAEIEGGTPGTPRVRVDLCREIWEVLTGGGSFEEVRQLSRRASGLASRIERRAHKTQGDGLGKALLEYTEFGATEATSRRAWGVHPSEWRYVAELAAFLGEKLERGLKLRGWPAGWLSGVEAYHEELAVLVEDQALQDMVLGALEAYSVPRGHGTRYTEVYGLCFGSVKAEEMRGRRWGRRRRVHVIVRRVALQLRAKTAPTYAVRSRRSQDIVLEMAHELFPQLELVGDFHSHPYQTLAELREVGGWNYNESDEADNLAWVEELAEQGRPGPRLALIMAVARAGRKGRAGKAPGPNVLRTQFGRCHCYLAAYRSRRDATYSSEKVSIRCPTITGLGS